MNRPQDTNWIVDALIDLNTYCEREGLDDISQHLIQAIESVAPIARNPATPCANRKTSQDHPDTHPEFEHRR